LKWPWGENDGPQDRPRALVHDAQPGDQLARGQAQLLDRVHLPDGVRLPRPGGRCGRPAGAGGRLAEGAQPALQRALARQGLAREEAPQLHAQPTGTPAGVIGAESQGGLTQRVVGPRLALAASAVIGPQARRAAGAEATE
jgi:hypothetical protein